MSSSDDREPAASQLENWQEKNKNQEYTIRDSSGIRVVKHDTSIRAGNKDGLMAIYDWNYFEQLGHFVRERIPERVVHAKGAGAFGYFEVTNDITQYTTAKLFNAIGKKTPISVRFSRVAGNLGSADSDRDPRGFAIKFFTEDGIWDLVGNNTPIFFMRDPKLFPMFIHSQKRNPSTNIMHDWDMFWDYLSLSSQSIHQVLFLFADRGIPDGYRHMHGYGSNTFSLINEEEDLIYVKFHYKTNQGIRNLQQKEAMTIAGEDPDYYVRDLYNAIAKGDFPSWTFYIQTMTIEQTKTCKFDPFDITKVWPHKDYPLIEVGKFTLNRNPINYFAEIEQIAFKPSNFVTGIGPSPDLLLQGRLFSYQDAHRYRLGANYEQLPTNCPFKICNYQRDGQSTINNQGGAPNYHPNSFNGPEDDTKIINWLGLPRPTISGNVDYFDSSDEDNFSQATIFYRQVLDNDAKTRLINNLADSLKKTSDKIRNRAIENFQQVDEDFGLRLKHQLKRATANL